MNITENPLLVFALSTAILWITARIGVYFRKIRADMDTEERENLGVILGATLGLLGLLIGFSFSMAVNRYDQRKNLEEAEANAIGTEFVRIDLLPESDAVKLRTLLRNYLDQRVFSYNTRDTVQLQKIDASTSQLRNELWTAVRVPAAVQPPPVTTILLSGMNDVLNSQGYTQAAWSNRIPTAAWVLMGAIALCGNLLLGYYASHVASRASLFLVLPLVLSIAFLEEMKAAGVEPSGGPKPETPACDAMRAIGQWNTAWDPFYELAPAWTSGRGLLSHPNRALGRTSYPPNACVVPMISFVAALQITSFDSVGPWSFNSAMITANLREAISGLVLWIAGREATENCDKTIALNSICFFFLLGALFGGLYTRLEEKHALAPCVAIVAAGFLLTWRKRRMQIRSLLPTGAVVGTGSSQN
jgi:hypothetical protein